jgi:putative FmdB family regulatory protein
MPIYVYKCTQCNEYHEALQKASDPLLTTCPACQAESLIKVIAPVGVIFKGTGFHKNDYTSTTAKSSGSSKPAQAEGASGGGDSAAASSGAESTSSTPAPAPAAGDSGGSASSGDKVA